MNLNWTAQQGEQPVSTDHGEKRIVMAENLPGGPAQIHRIELDFKSTSAASAIAQIGGFYVERVNYFGWLFLVFYVLSASGLVVTGGLLAPRLFVKWAVTGYFCLCRFATCALFGGGPDQQNVLTS